jgi:hypothetical protein
MPANLITLAAVELPDGKAIGRSLRMSQNRSRPLACPAREAEELAAGAPPSRCPALVLGSIGIRSNLALIKEYQIVDCSSRGQALDECRAKAHHGEMKLTRMIAVFLLTLGLTLGSAAGISLATEQAFAAPCPMEQNGDCPCKDRCDSAVMTCVAKCSAPFGEAVLLKYVQLYALAGVLSCGADSYPGSQFKGGPATPIPIV